MDELIYLEPRETFDSMIIGLCLKDIRIVYDADKLINYWKACFKDENTSDDQALEDANDWFNYNVLNAYIGEHTPIYVSKEFINITFTPQSIK